MRVRGIIILLLVIAGLIIPWVLSTPAFAQWGEVADVKATCSATNPGGESVLSVTVSATYGYDLKNLILRLDNLPTELVLIQSEKSLKLIKHGETQVMTIRIGTKPETPNGRYLVRFHLYHSI